MPKRTPFVEGKEGTHILLTSPLDSVCGRRNWNYHQCCLVHQDLRANTKVAHASVASSPRGEDRACTRCVM